jgi:flagellin
MAISLVSNLSSLGSQSRLAATSNQLNQTLRRLSSGLRINSSGDDAAGLAIANKYRSDISVLSQGVRNANDGLSTLQIIDGGLNTISNLLDRASTLASQSASDTFTGDRATLQAEFSNVLDEITRQAENIGLVNGGANNKALTTVIGGGSDTFAAVNGNNGVQVDLSGSANRVDATSLSLNSLNIGATTGSATGSGANGIDFSSSTATLGQNETLTFQKVGANGTLESFTVSLTSGQTANSVLSQLQSDTNLKNAGITAKVSGTDLVFESANFFTVVSSVAAATTNSTGIEDTVRITSAANNTTVFGRAATASATQYIDFTIGSSSTITRVGVTTSTASAAASADNIVSAINGNTTLRDAGIFAVKTTGSTVKIVSTKNTFSAVVESTSTAANNGVELTSGSNNQGAATVAAGTGSGGADGAKAALDAIKTAITTLGKVQGTVGSGQNRLLQAIDLATSQINNFQAAESRVRDADVSAEASNLSRLTVLQQAGVAALAQANQSAQAVLSLLR